MGNLPIGGRIVRLKSLGPGCLARTLQAALMGSNLQGGIQIIQIEPISGSAPPRLSQSHPAEVSAILGPPLGPPDPLFRRYHEQVWAPPEVRDLEEVEGDIGVGRGLEMQLPQQRSISEGVDGLAFKSWEQLRAAVISCLR